MTEPANITSQLFEILHRLKKRKEALQVEIEQVDKDIESVNHTMRLVRTKLDRAALSDLTETVQPSYSDLQGKTQSEALIGIARNNGGRLKISDAKEILIRVGLIKKPKHAWTIVYNAVNRDSRFTKTGKGEYRLVEDGQLGFMQNLK